MTCSTINVACMKWPNTLEPICAGSNRRKVVREAVRLLKIEHGEGPVNRPAAMSSAKITASDIEIVTVPLVANAEIAAGDSPYAPNAGWDSQSAERTHEQYRT